MVLAAYKQAKHFLGIGDIAVSKLKHVIVMMRIIYMYKVLMFGLRKVDRVSHYCCCMVFPLRQIHGMVGVSS